MNLRCDAPDLLRRLRLVIDSGPEKQVLFSFTVVEETPRPPIPLTWVADSQTPAKFTMCSWCQAVKTPHGWYQVTEAIDDGQLLDGPSIMVSHGICEQCLARIEALLEEDAP